MSGSGNPFDPNRPDGSWYNWMFLANHGMILISRRSAN